MSRPFEVGDRVRYTGETNDWIRHGDTGTVTGVDIGGSVWAIWENSPSDWPDTDWSADAEDCEHLDPQ